MNGNHSEYVRCQCGNSIPVPSIEIEDFSHNGLKSSMVAVKAICDKCGKGYVFKFEMRPVVIDVSCVEIIG